MKKSNKAFYGIYYILLGMTFFLLSCSSKQRNPSIKNDQLNSSVNDAKLALKSVLEESDKAIKRHPDKVQNLKEKVETIRANFKTFEDSTNNVENSNFSKQADANTVKDIALSAMDISDALIKYVEDSNLNDTTISNRIIEQARNSIKTGIDMTISAVNEPHKTNVKNAYDALKKANTAVDAAVDASLNEAAAFNIMNKAIENVRSVIANAFS